MGKYIVRDGDDRRRGGRGGRDNSEERKYSDNGYSRRGDDRGGGRDNDNGYSRRSRSPRRDSRDNGNSRRNDDRRGNDNGGYPSGDMKKYNSDMPRDSGRDDFRGGNGMARK